MIGPVVECRAGKLRGSVERSILGQDYYAFKGVPYAKPPVGQLRFRDPEPVEPHNGIKDATKFASICAQNKFPFEVFEGSDDCLYLNVYLKSIEPSQRRPVMVWIHGGGYLIGDGNDGFYAPDYLVRKDIVLVTINYRLGVLGFLNLENEVAPGNQGLKDQVMALRWIRDNIASFGGDPGNVTIFGESAGSASVHYLTLSTLAKGLFHKAICQSGVVLNPWAHLTINPKRFAFQMCTLLGNKTRDPKEIVDFLRTIDCKKLIEIQDQLLTKEEHLQTVYPFGPGIDSKSENPFMPIHPTIAAQKGVQVPLLIGYNSNEEIVSIKHMGPDYITKFNSNIEKCLNPNVLKVLSEEYKLTADELKRLYFKNDELSDGNLEKLITLIGDVKFVEGIHRVIRIQIEKSSAPTYLYQYTYDKTMSFIKTLFKTPIKGACHVDEIQHLFHAKNYDSFSFEPLKRGTIPYKIMEQMTDLWVNFASTGRPTPNKTQMIPFYWQPLTSEIVLRYLNICEDFRMENTLNLKNVYTSHEFPKNKL